MVALEAAWGSGVPWLSACKAGGGGAHKVSLQCLCCCSPQANQLPPLLIVFSQTISKSNYICKDVPTMDTVQPHLMKTANLIGG